MYIHVRHEGKMMNRVWTFIKGVLTSEYLALVLRVYIGWVFVYAGLSKILDPAVFAENVASYRIIPYWGLNMVAVILPWLELVCGFFLILGLRTRAVASIITGLLTVFTVFVIVNIFWKSPINCGCFDTASEPIGWKKVAINTTWLIMTVQIFFFDKIMLFCRGYVDPKKNAIMVPVKKKDEKKCDVIGYLSVGNF
jgi:uncharacterized membrane protein YphA (DoxX/SURF4 family)